MEIIFHTNLDLAQPFVYQLNYRSNKSHNRIPRIGEKIEFFFDKRKSFELEVVSIRNEFNVFDEYANTIQRVVIELHIPKIRNQSISEWEEYFNRHVKGY